MQYKKRTIHDLIEIEEYLIEQEWYILTYSIMSNSMIKFVYQKYKQKEIKLKHFVGEFQIIFKMVMDYYKKHKKAPKETIQVIFENLKPTFDDSTIEILDTYLERLAEEYVGFQENCDEDGINPDFIKTDMIPDFVRKREAEILVEKLQRHLDRGDYAEIDKTIDSVARVTPEIDENIEIETVEDILKQKGQKQKYCWRNLFPQGAMCLLTASGGTGKTTFAVEICKEIFFKNLNSKIKRRRRRRPPLIIWVYCDRPVGEWVEKLNFAFNQNPPNRYFIPAQKRENDETSYQWNFKYSKDVNRLVNFIRAVENKYQRKTAIVVVDTLISVTSGLNENTYEIVKPMRELHSTLNQACPKATLLFIHHNGKGKDVYRGFSGIQDAPAIHLLLKNTPIADIKEVHVEKCNLPNLSTGHVLNFVRHDKEFEIVHKEELERFGFRKNKKLNQTQYGIQHCLYIMDNPKELTPENIEEMIKISGGKNKKTVQRELRDTFKYKYIKRKGLYLKQS